MKAKLDDFVSGNDGDTDTPFSIDPPTGEITINDVDELSGYHPIYTLEVKVSDGVNTSNLAIVTIALTGYPIPTLSEWGLLILALILSTLGIVAIRNRQSKLIYKSTH